jgi:hypothetical protein
MAKRYFIVQWCHERRGWLDLPLCGHKRVELEREAREFTEEHRVVTRVIRKPKGWVPPPPKENDEIPQIGVKVEQIQVPPSQPDLDPLEAPGARDTDPARLWRLAQTGDRSAAEAYTCHLARTGDIPEMAELGVLAFYFGWHDIIPHLKPAYPVMLNYAKAAQNEDFLRLLGW